MASALDFVSGCIGGAAGVIIGHPFDTIKVIIQTNSQRLSLMSVVRQSSFSSLYKGIKAPLSGLAGINAIVFGVHGNIMRQCPAEMTNKQRYQWCTISGAVSGFTQSIISCPADLVKTRAQLSSTPALRCAKEIFHSEGGTRALFRGFWITLARDCPAFATYFLTYEMLLDYTKKPTSTFGLLMAGGTAGALSWLVIYPLDVIKSRYQATLDHPSIGQCVKTAYKEEGGRVFWKGCWPTLLRAFPSNAATFAVVTWTLRLAEKNEEDPELLEH